MHNGIMQRHSGSISTFIAVHEPFGNSTWIDTVITKGHELMVRFTVNGTSVENTILFKDSEITVASSAGWKYRSGKEFSGIVEALETRDGKWSLRLDRKAPKVNYVRLNLPDGGTRYYPVAEVNGNYLELVDDPGFTLEKGSGKILFHTFPHDQYNGKLGYTLFVPVRK